MSNFCYSDDLKTLVNVEFSDEGSNMRKKEEQAWVHFVDFLDECDGKKNHCVVYS